MVVSTSTLIFLPTLFSFGSSAVIPQPRVKLLSPQGVRFEVPGRTCASSVDFHYNINSPLLGMKAGQYDITVNKSQGTFVHENRGIAVGAGDAVYFWVRMVINGRGYYLLEQKWTAGGGSILPQQREDLQLVFEDTFDYLDLNKWGHDVSLYGNMNKEFQAYTPEPSNSYVRDNTLFLRPTLTSDRFGEEFLRQGVWDMTDMYGRCTDGGDNGCRREGRDGLLNPIMSAKLTSKASIKYGRVEVHAKMPKGDWLWPVIQMLPKRWKYGGYPASGQIVVGETRGNINYGGLGLWNIHSTLHWGVNPGSNRWPLTNGQRRASPVSFAEEFHKYVLDWTKDHIKISVDDLLVLNVPTPGEGFFSWGNQPEPNIWASGDKNAPFDDDFYLIFNLGVGGTNGYFPDGLKNEGGYPKPWQNTESNITEKFWSAKNQWYPTWRGEDAAMQVKYVRMWKQVINKTPHLEVAQTAS